MLRRLLALAPLLFALACPASETEESCTPTPQGFVDICSEDPSFPWDTPLVGSFSGAGAARTFAVDGGDTYPLTVELGVPLGPILGDLSSYGTVEIKVSGSCDPKGASSTALEVRDPGGELLFAAGNVPAWSSEEATVDDGDGACTAFAFDACSCWSACAPQEIRFTVGDSSIALHQGEQSVVGDFTGFVLRSWDGIDRTCADGPSDTVRVWGLVSNDLAR